MNSTPVLSVVIPTRDRRATLEATLAALDRQTGIDAAFEVVVVDDGSSDGTSAWIADQTYASFDLVTDRTAGVGPAAARNLGIGRSRAKTVLLLGDDTIPTPSTLAAHLATAGGREVGVQGRIEWDPTVEITPVMDFLAPEGPQFWFKGLTDRCPVPFTSVYGSNLSAPRRWFVEEPFDESYAHACFEDTEQAWRWRRRGWEVVFGADAVCRHRHRYETLEPFLDRQRSAGAATRRLATRHPSLLWPLVVMPSLVGFRQVCRFVLKGAVRRLTVADRSDLRCRSAWFLGLVARRFGDSDQSTT